MKARNIITIILLVLGGILALMPTGGKYTLHGSPATLWAAIVSDSNSFSADQVARFVAGEDSTVQLVDLRNAEEYRKFTIPGAVNLPYATFLEQDPEPFLSQAGKKIILFSNGDRNAGYALVLAKGLGYQNCYVMKGGINEWFATVMNSSFPEGPISARENALFAARLKARRLCTEINSMPDSLKAARLNAKKFDPKKLDGGCE